LGTWEVEVQKRKEEGEKRKENEDYYFLLA
jgi:hypothetical protein